MLDLETIGYYLYMEEQENRSRELKPAIKSGQAPQQNFNAYFGNTNFS